MKIGLMGGTFDPPHKAHIAMAQAAMRELSLEKVIFMTGGNPPHKTTLTDAKMRHHMVKLAIAPYEHFVPCEYEINREAYSYTSDTLIYLTETHPDDVFYFIIGGDSFGAFFTWHEPEVILKKSVLAVFPRAGFPTEQDVHSFCENNSAEVHILHEQSYDISSTEIREMVENGLDYSQYLDEEVYAYIQRNALYHKKLGTDEERLKPMLSEKRYQHSLGVAAVAVKMAGLYGEDVKKAYLAGLLHDCAKNLTIDEAAEKCRDFEIELDEIEKKHHGLVHAKIGAELVKTVFDIHDPEICSAIRWHTLGRVGMRNLEKIIFVADMIEPNRRYPEVNFLRKCAYSDLDMAVLECVSATIRFNEEKGKTIHPNAFAIRDWLVNLGVKYCSAD